MKSTVAKSLFTFIFFLATSFYLAAQTLFTTGASWKYLDNGSNPGSTWNTEEYSDATWKTGNSILGYGEPNITTTVSFGPDASNKYITTYFRKTINIPDISIYTGMKINVKRDDGIVLYVNGVEQFRDNMPAGTITSSTFAAGVSNDDGQNFIPFDLDITNLKSGNNTIAAEIHQVNLTSSDLSFDAELIASDATTPSPSISWFWSGGLTSNSIKVNVKTVSASNVRVAFSKTADLVSPIFSDVAAGITANNFTTSHTATGLTPSTKYYYGFEINGTMGPQVGSFKTVIENAPYSFKFALGSCSEAASNHVVFDSIRAMKPDFFIATGDFFYADIAENNINRYRSHYNGTLSSPRQSALYHETPSSYMWDDHDYGPNNSDASSPSKPAAVASYKENAPHYPLVHSEAIYQAFTVGRVRFILSDLRSQKVPSSGTMMGATQLTWFKNEVLKAKEEGKMIAWISSMPYLSTGGGDASDNWASYPAERTEIANYLQANGVKDIFILSGDAHMIAIDNGTNSDFSSNKQGPRIPVFHAAALDRGGSYKGGPYSVGAFQGGGQFGLVEVTDNGGSNLCIKFRGRSASQINDIINYSFCSNTITSLTSGVQDLSALNVTQSKESLEINYNMQSAGNIRFELVDLKGIGVYDKSINAGAGTLHHQISLSNFHPGIYHLLLKGDKENLSYKLSIR